MGSCIGLADSLSFGDPGRTCLQIIICDLSLTFLSRSPGPAVTTKGMTPAIPSKSLLWNGDKHVFNRQEF